MHLIDARLGVFARLDRLPADMPAHGLTMAELPHPWITPAPAAAQSRSLLPLVQLP